MIVLRAEISRFLLHKASVINHLKTEWNTMLYKKLLTVLPLLAAFICPLAQGASENQEADPISLYSPLTARLTSAEGEAVQQILQVAPTNVLKIAQINAFMAQRNTGGRSIAFKDIITAAQKGGAASSTPGRTTLKLSEAMQADPSLWLDHALAAVGMPRLDKLFVWNAEGVYLPEAALLAALQRGETVFAAPTYANAQFQNGVQRLQLTEILQTEESMLAGPLQLVFSPGTDKEEVSAFEGILSFMPGHPLQLTVSATAVGTLTRVPAEDAAELPQVAQRFQELPEALRLSPHTVRYGGEMPESAWHTPYLQSVWNWITYLASFFDWRSYR